MTCHPPRNCSQTLAAEPGSCQFERMLQSGCNPNSGLFCARRNRRKQKGSQRRRVGRIIRARDFRPHLDPASLSASRGSQLAAGQGDQALPALRRTCSASMPTSAATAGAASPLRRHSMKRALHHHRPARCRRFRSRRHRQRPGGSYARRTRQAPGRSARTR